MLNMAVKGNQKGLKIDSEESGIEHYKAQKVRSGRNVK